MIQDNLDEKLRDAIHNYAKQNPEPSEELKRDLELLGYEAAEYRYRLIQQQGRRR